MYNRYLEQSADHADSGWTSAAPPPVEHREARPPGMLGELTGGLGDALGGLLKNFSLGDLDMGDILLVLIILLVFLDGDDLEIVITLGLMLLLGLGDHS